MGAISKTILIAVIIILLLIFFPKYSGDGAVCFGCDNMKCTCAGIIDEWNILGDERVMCIGIPYNCQPVQAEDLKKE